MAGRSVAPRSGLRDVLFGKKSSQGLRANGFSRDTAAVTLDTELGLRTAGDAGLSSSRSRQVSCAG